MGRPADWAPLGCASDPVPGDPGAVSTEAAHLAGVARQVTGQVAALRRIAATADGGSLRGVFAARAGICAADVAGQLAQVAGRYEKHQQPWPPGRQNSSTPRPSRCGP